MPSSTTPFVSTARLWPVGLIILGLYALDQGTKALVMSRLALGESREVIPGFFTVAHQGNTGAAFSVLTNNNGFFLALSVVAAGVLMVLSWRGAFRDALAQAGFCGLMAGVLGNLTDRVLHGHVVDFLSFDLHIPYAHPWPTFNVADSCIFLAVACFLIGSWREMRQAEP